MFRQRQRQTEKNLLIRNAKGTTKRLLKREKTHIAFSSCSCLFVGPSTKAVGLKQNVFNLWEGQVRVFLNIPNMVLPARTRKSFKRYYFQHQCQEVFVNEARSSLQLLQQYSWTSSRNQHSSHNLQVCSGRSLSVGKQWDLEMTESQFSKENNLRDRSLEGRGLVSEEKRERW